MVKLDLKPSLSISLRRMRTQAEWKVETHISRARGPTSASTRSFISAAALLVKVIARIEPGWAPRWETSQAMRRVSTRVLPEPAPATTSSGVPSWTTAARCGSLSPARRSSARRLCADASACASRVGRPAEGLADDREGVAHLPSTLRAATPGGTAYRRSAVGHRRCWRRSARGSASRARPGSSACAGWPSPAPGSPGRCANITADLGVVELLVAALEHADQQQPGHERGADAVAHRAESPASRGCGPAPAGRPGARARRAGGARPGRPARPSWAQPRRVVAEARDLVRRA